MTLRLIAGGTPPAPALEYHVSAMDADEGGGFVIVSNVKEVVRLEQGGVVMGALANRVIAGPVNDEAAANDFCRALNERVAADLEWEAAYDRWMRGEGEEPA